MSWLVLALLLSGAPQKPIPPAAQRGPTVGQVLPAFEAVDQQGQRRDFASLRGEKGLVLVLVQSADW